MMARDHARLYLSVWNDPDWRNLTVAAQHAYALLVSHQRLSYCGVLDYFPSRISTLASDLTERKVRAAVSALEVARFVITDESTDELLVRSYVRHDGVMDRLNMGKATAVAVEQVCSAQIRDAVLNELGRLMSEKPTLAGWTGFKEKSPIAFDIACAMASTIPFPIETSRR